MLINFEELAAVCKKVTFGGNCEVMIEVEAVSNMDDPDFSQGCDCCEEHCPLKEAESQAKAQNTARGAIALERYREYLRLDNRRKTDISFIRWCEQQHP